MKIGSIVSIAPSYMSLLIDHSGYWLYLWEDDTHVTVKSLDKGHLCYWRHNEVILVTDILCE